MSSRQAKKRMREWRDEQRKAAQEIAVIRGMLGEVYVNFNSTTDPELIDAYIYEINSLRARYDHALKRAKVRLL